MLNKRESFGSNTEVRSTRWMAFAKQHGAFGFEKLANANLPQMSHKKHGISVSFEKIRGWRVPKSLLRGLSDGNCEVTMHLNLSLFHMTSSTFLLCKFVNRRASASVSHDGNISAPLAPRLRTKSAAPLGCPYHDLNSLKLIKPSLSVSASKKACCAVAAARCPALTPIRRCVPGSTV